MFVAHAHNVHRLQQRVMSRSVLCAAAKSAKSANRFIRFGYRTPPPWQLSVLASQLDSLADSADISHTPDPDHSHRQSNEFNSIDHSAWPEIRDNNTPLVPVQSDQDPTMVPVLAHGMDVVLRGDGVYPLEAPWIMGRGRKPHLHRHGNKLHRPPRGRFQTYYGDSLRKIVQPDSIAWDNIPGYVPAAQDTKLHQLADITPGVQYCSSTSSITPAISALYHLLSNFRDTDLNGGLSSHIAQLPSYFSKMHRRPVAFVVKRNDSENPVYSVNAHAGPATGPSILRDLGHSMERMLTTSPDEFLNKYVLSTGGTGIPQGEDINATGRPSSGDEQFYHYSRVSKFLLRAQIDCRNAKTGEVFDVKTRAVAPIRYDLENYESFSSHRLRFLRGKSDSYEREFYDMVRSVFLKYALQLRIGRMSGALVAYHNTSEILGLEYISLKEMHSYIFGGERWADIAFGTAVHLMEEVLKETTKALCRDEPNEKLKVVMFTEWSRLKMYIFVQRIQDGEYDPFGSDAFLETGSSALKVGERAEVEQEDLSAAGQWHVDSFLHNKGRGISAVGSHDNIRRLGGQKLERIRDQVAPQSSKRPPAETYDYLNYDCSSLTRDRFRVWELNVFPLVNNELAPRNMIRLGKDDTFRLKYHLKEIPEVKKEHLAKFVSSLGRIYAY